MNADMLGGLISQIKTMREALRKLEDQLAKAKENCKIQEIKELVPLFLELDEAFASARREVIQLEDLANETGMEDEASPNLLFILEDEASPSKMHDMDMDIHMVMAPPLSTMSAGEDYVRIKVGFGTNREIEWGVDAAPDTQEMIPYAKKDGVLFRNGRKKWNKGIIETSPSACVYVGTVTVQVRKKDLSLFSNVKAFLNMDKGSAYLDKVSVLGSLKDVAKAMELSAETDVLIFIHGFSVSFEDAAKAAAKLKAQIGIPTAFFSWASAASLLAYSSDEACIDTCERAIVDFLLGFLDGRINSAKVHVIAHSMGNRGLVRALQQIQTRALIEKEGDKAGALKFGQVVFAAPDVDAQLFLDIAEHSFANLADGFTLYSSSGDKALGVSGGVHDQPRVGRHIPYTVCPTAFTTIAAESVKTDLLGHSYFSTSPAILGDIRSIIIGKKKLADRIWLEAIKGVSAFRLTEEQWKKDGDNCWHFKHE